MLIEGELEDGTPVTLPGVLPKLSETPGDVRRRAPVLGQDTQQILDRLGIDAATRDDWKARGII